MVNFQDFESLMNLLSKLTLLALPVALAACGGGGSSDQTCSSDLYTLNRSCTQNVSTALPEGIWFGATTSSTAAQTIVLENGQYFSIYTNTSDGSLVWLTEGVMTAANGNLTDNSSSVAVTSSNVIINASLTGTFTAKSSLLVNSSVNTAGATTGLSFNGTYSPAYDTPIAITDVSGAAWTNPSNTANTVTFQANGSASGTQNGCTFSGTFAPRATGKHLLDGTLTFTNAVCAAGINTQMPVEATVVNGKLTIVGITPQRTTAFYMSASR